MDWQPLFPTLNVSQVRGLAITGSILGYLLLAFLFYPTHGVAATPLILLPIVAGSWHFDLRTGFGVAIILCVVHVVILSMVTGRPPTEIVFYSVPGFLAAALVTGVVSRIHQVRKQLEQETRQRIEAEDALQKNELRFITFVEQSPFSTQIFRPDGSVITANEAFGRLWNANEVERQYIIDHYNVLKDEQLEKSGLMSFIRRGFTDGYVEIPEIKYDPQKTDMVRETGLTTKWVIGYIWPVKDDAGAVQQVVLIHQDITERKQVEAQQLEMAVIQERADLLKELLNTLSHDLKTPLSIMNTSLYLLEKTQDPVNQQSKIDNLKEQAQRLNTILQHILTASYLDTAPDAVIQPFDLNTLVQQVEQEFRTVAEDRSIRLDVTLESELPPVSVNDIEFRRVLVNLIENALNYTPSEGRITLRTYRNASQVVIEVRDTGIGIEQADLSHIFDHFYRADKARATHSGGTGLGLAIVKKIVERHEGRIDVESQPGVGTCFRVCLPLQES